MDDKDIRQYGDQCTLGTQMGPQTIIVRQIVGEQQQQKALDIHVVVPRQKPGIEQIIDVFVKELEVTSVDVITDKVVVRGSFEIKAIYVACVPEQSVHAVEIKHYRWTRDIEIFGARKGMDADASVVVEFIDYDITDNNTRAYKYKHCDYDHEEEEEDVCETLGSAIVETPIISSSICMPIVESESVSPAAECAREFDVSVILKITAKVMTDREVQLNPQMPYPMPPVPPVPKG